MFSISNLDAEMAYAADSAVYDAFKEKLAEALNVSLEDLV